MKTISKLLGAILLTFTFFGCSKEPLLDKTDSSSSSSSSTQVDESMQKHGNTFSVSKKVDKAFMIASAQDCALEIMLGNLAQINGSNPDVLLYGQKMVVDHTQEYNDLNALAQANGMSLPTGIHGTQHQIVHKLSKLHGNDFDIEYLKFNGSHHRADIAAADNEVNYGTDTALKDYVTTTLLPMHWDHLGYAIQIATALGIVI